VSVALGEAARDYAAAGWAVFPLQPRGKKPLTDHGFHDASTEAAEVRGWWHRWPDANIGLAIPRGLVVLDLDSPDALNRIKAEDLSLPSTAAARTGRGWHLWYGTGAVQLSNRVGIAAGVDLRTEGGYVVAPPSIHATGAIYHWEVPLQRNSIAPAPDWLLAAAARERDIRARPAEVWRQRTAQDVSKGRRNHELASLAGHLLRARVDPYVTLNLMRCWNAVRCKPPLGDVEVARTVDSIARLERRRRTPCA
jgi:hypothetical protein